MLRRVALMAAAMTVVGVVSAAPAGAEANSLQLVAVRLSILGTHYVYQQTYKGLPVVDGYFAEHVGEDGKVFAVTDDRKAIQGDVSIRPGVGSDQAEQAAATRAPGHADRATLSILPGPRSRLVWQIRSSSARSDTNALVDARTGKVIEVRDLIKDATGTGRVFEPNPVVTLQDQTLTDQNDSDYPALQAAYRTVTLTDLDGSGHLTGSYANVALKKGAAFERSEVFAYNRLDDRFEQVMAYYDVTQAQ